VLHRLVQGQGVQEILVVLAVLAEQVGRGRAVSVHPDSPSERQRQRQELAKPNSTGEAMEISDQAIWAESDLETATAGLPSLGELMGVESSGPTIEAEESEEESGSEGETAIAAPLIKAGSEQQGRVEAVKAKLAEVATKAGIPEDAVDAIYEVAIEKIGEILSEIDLAGGILGEAWSKVFEIVEYRELLEQIQADGAIMIPLVSHEVLAEQSPSIDLKFQETPVGTFGVDLSLGFRINSATLAMKDGKLTHLHLGSMMLTGGIEFAGLPLFEAPEASLEINRVVRLGEGIVIKLRWPGS